MLKIYFTYKLIFPNGKIYVGMSSTKDEVVLTNRYKQHKKAAKIGKQSPLYKAWRKYGDPIQEIIDCYATREDCADAEINLIASLDSTNPQKGYNLMHGGDGLNAPFGSPMHNLMREKVWNNKERSRKLSEANKGKKPTPEAIKAYRKWLEDGGAEKIRNRSKNMWLKKGYREAASERTKKQMTPEAKAYLSNNHKGRKDPRSEEGKRIAKQKLQEYLATEAGKANCRKGNQIAFSKKENVEKRNAGLAKWRESDANKENCKRIAALSAKACSKKVKDLNTGVVYDSQRAMAKALGLSDGAITLRIKSGNAERL